MFREDEKKVLIFYLNKAGFSRKMIRRAMLLSDQDRNMQNLLVLWFRYKQNKELLKDIKRLLRNKEVTHAE